MKRVPKGRETREELLIFPVGTDRPARRRPTAALELPVSRVLASGRLRLELTVTASVPAPQPIRLTGDDMWTVSADLKSTTAYKKEGPGRPGF